MPVGNSAAGFPSRGPSCRKSALGCTADRVFLGWWDIRAVDTVSRGPMSLAGRNQFAMRTGPQCEVMSNAGRVRAPYSTASYGAYRIMTIPLRLDLL